MEIKITREMIEAGQRALAARGKDSVDQKLLCEVWRAMAAQCPPIRVVLPEGAAPQSIVIEFS